MELIKKNKNLFKRLSTLLICFCLLCSFLINNTSSISAKSSTKGNIKVVQDDSNIYEIVDEYQGDKLYATFNKETQKITMKAVEKPKSKLKSLFSNEATVTSYEVKVQDLGNPDKPSVSALIIDTNTKKEYKIGDYDKVKAQGAAVIPLIDILGAEILEALGEAGLATIISGVTYAVASSIADTLRNKSNHYYEAYIKNNDVYIGPAIDFATAVTRARIGKDVMCLKARDAYQVAYSVYLDKTKLPVGPEIGKKGDPRYYYHYHVWDRSTASHIFYLGT